MARRSWNARGAIFAAVLADTLAINMRQLSDLSAVGSTPVGAALIQLTTKSLTRANVWSGARYTIVGESPSIATVGSFPAIHDKSETLQWLLFWRGERANSRSKGLEGGGAKPDSPKRYLTFNTDPGGFNNMRMAFEHYIDMALVSNRILVLPPREGWYLIDWGPLDSNDKNDKKWIKGDFRSTYPEFYDVDYLRGNGLDVISSEDFYEQERRRFSIPESARPDAKFANSPDPTPWKDWLEEHATGPRGCQDAETFAKSEAPLVHFGIHKARFLNCAYSTLLEQKGTPAQAMLHYSPSVFELAAGPVAEMGAGRYASLHLRRNDFQYVQAPTAEGSSELLQKLTKLLQPREPVYIASDEIDSDWWKGFRSALAEIDHPLYSLKDFKADLEAKGMNARNAGLVEQVICAGGRMFLGTPISTFTGGIQHLRDQLAQAHRLAAQSGNAEKADAGGYHTERLFAML